MSHAPESMARTVAETVIALVLFGCIPVVIRYVHANPYTIGIVRLAIATAGLALVMRDRPAIRSLSFADFARLGVIGVFFFAHWIVFFFAIKISSASIGTIGLSTYGIHLLVLGAIFGGARFTLVDVSAVALAIGGVILTVPTFSLGNEATVGMLLGTASAFFYATLPILHQRWSHMSSSVRAMGQFAVALACFLVFIPRAEFDLRPVDWASLAFLGVASTLVGHGLWVRVTTRLRPATTSIVYYGSVPIALALAVLLLREPLAARTALGASMIVGGSMVGLYYRWRSARGSRQLA